MFHVKQNTHAPRAGRSEGSLVTRTRIPAALCVLVLTRAFRPLGQPTNQATAPPLIECSNLSRRGAHQKSGGGCVSAHVLAATRCVPRRISRENDDGRASGVSVPNRSTPRTHSLPYLGMGRSASARTHATGVDQTRRSRAGARPVSRHHVARGLMSRDKCPRRPPRYKREPGNEPVGLLGILRRNPRPGVQALQRKRTPLTGACTQA